MIYLARHGQTAFNAEGRFQGRANSRLTPLGVAQAGRIGQLLRTLTAPCTPITLWSSPLGRAAQTAEIVQQHLPDAPSIRYDPRLQEVSLGCWEGLTHPEIEALHPGLRDGAGYYDWFFLSPDGESLASVEARMRDWLAEVALEPGCHIAISHGLAGRLLRGVYTGLNRDDALELDIPQDAIFRASRRHHPPNPRLSHHLYPSEGICCCTATEPNSSTRPNFAACLSVATLSEAKDPAWSLQPPLSAPL